MRMDGRDYYLPGRAGDPMPSVVDCHYRPFTQSCTTAETRDQRADPGQQPAGWSGMGVIDDTALGEACRPMATVYTFIRAALTGHGIRVARYARAIASQLGESPEFCGQIAMAALFHDIGKVGVSKTLLDKPGRLTAEEFATVRTHTWLGARMLERSARPQAFGTRPRWRCSIMRGSMVAATLLGSVARRSRYPRASLPLQMCLMPCVPGVRINWHGQRRARWTIWTSSKDGISTRPVCKRLSRRRSGSRKRQRRDQHRSKR